MDGDGKEKQPTVGNLGYSQLKQENSSISSSKKPNVLGKLLRGFAALGILGGSTTGIVTGPQAVGGAIEQAGQIKDSIGLTEDQKEGIKKYQELVKNNPELIKRNLVVYDPENKLEKINIRNQHRVNDPEGISAISVGTILEEAIEVYGEDPFSLPERPRKGIWLFYSTKKIGSEVVDGHYIWGGYAREMKPEEKNPLTQAN